MERLVPDFERERGYRFDIAVMLNPEVPEYIATGARWDIAPVGGVFAAAICPVDLGVHIDLSLCVSRNASGAAREFADWLIDPSLNDTLSRLGAERFSLVAR